MFVIHTRTIRDHKINQLRQGISAYAETNELIRLIKRDILKYDLHVYCDETQTGCWFIPVGDHCKSG